MLFCLYMVKNSIANKACVAKISIFLQMMSWITLSTGRLIGLIMRDLDQIRNSSHMIQEDYKWESGSTINKIKYQHDILFFVVIGYRTWNSILTLNWNEAIFQCCTKLFFPSVLDNDYSRFVSTILTIEWESGTFWPVQHRR